MYNHSWTFDINIKNARTYPFEQGNIQKCTNVRHHTTTKEPQKNSKFSQVNFVIRHLTDIKVSIQLPLIAV